MIPGFATKLFADVSSLNVIANIGLVLYLFLVGMEVDLGEMKKNFKRSALISLSGIVFPCLFGVGASKIVYDTLQDDKTIAFSSFALFLGVAMSITVRFLLCL
jgi:Kef-type K+ transport system membrane component KefB